MGVQYNLDEVLRMAERIEENAADFYSRAASLHSGTADVEFLRKLARMELEHRQSFSTMRGQLSPEMRQIPEAYPYLKATLFLYLVADTLGREGTLSQAQPLTNEDTLEDLIRKGIGFEERTILFYLGLKDAVPTNRGRNEVDAIIEMEKDHLAELADKLQEITKTRTSVA